MANTIILKRSATPGKVPTTAQLALGEIAINTYDGLIYIKKDNGTASIAQIGGVTSVNGETGSITLSSDDVSDAGQTNKWFANSLARGAISAGTGISYNSGTGVISTSQSITSAATPTFAGLTLNGNLSMTGDIIPSADIAYDLGSPSRQWRDVYVGPGSLYVNGQKVLQDDSGTITFSADLDENIRIKTLGTGILQLGSSTSNIQVDGTLTMASGKRITDAAGTNVQFGNPIHMNSNKITNLGAPSANADAATKLYVDTAIGAVSTSSIASGNSNISVIDSGTGTVTVTVDGSTALTVDANGVTVAGNFTVSGTQTVVNSSTINLADNILTLNSDATGAPSQPAGIEVERGDEANVQIRWNEGSDTWTFTNNGSTYFPMAVGTDDLAEGSTNLYHTTARARQAISSSSATGVSYNGSTGAISLGSIPNSSLSNNSITINGTAVALGGTRTLDTDSVSEGTNKYFTDARAISANTSAIATAKSEAISAAATDATTKANAAQAAAISAAASANAATATKLATARTINGVSFDGSANISFSSTAVSEGTNLYFTDARARSALSFAGGSGAYNGSTGVITIPTNTNQLTNGANFATESFVNSAVAGKDNTDEITEGSTNRFFTDARARAAVSASGSLSYNSTTGVFSYTTPSTSSVSEGSNLYYTDARARAAVSFTAGSGAYNSSTGAFTIPTNTNQLTNGAGFITGYTETSTLANVTARGATTSSAMSTGALTVTGGITATGEITAYYSDDRLKKDVVAITNPIAKLMQIRGVTFRPNETALALGITDKEEVGVIAQEVQAVLPQLVTGSAFEGYVTVKYDKLTALLIEAVKEQQQQIDELKALVARLVGGI